MIARKRNPDIARTSAGQDQTQPDSADATYPDKTGHTPLGVSGCPGGLSGFRGSGAARPATPPPLKHTQHCTRCQLWHSEPRCSHDPDAACVGCGKPRGYRWMADDGRPAEPADLCWRCATGRSRAEAGPPPPDPLCFRR